MSGSLLIIFAKGSCNVGFYIFATMGLYEMIYPSRLIVGPRGYVLKGDENMCRFKFLIRYPIRPSSKRGLLPILKFEFLEIIQQIMATSDFSSPHIYHHFQENLLSLHNNQMGKTVPEGLTKGRTRNIGHNVFLCRSS